MWLAFALFVKQVQPQICPLGQTLMLSLHQEGIPPHLDIQRGQDLTDEMEFSPMPIFQHLGAQFLSGTGMLTLMRMRHGVTDPQVARVRDWSLITGRGGFKMGKSRVRNFLRPPLKTG